MRRSRRWFTTAPVGAIKKLLEKTSWKANDGRPVRDQRSLRGGHHGGDEGARPAARQGQRAWRRLRAWPSDRRFGRAHPGHADRRAAQAAAASAASPACASAAAKRPRWLSSSLEERPPTRCSTAPQFLRPYGFRVVAADDEKCTLELPHRAALERPGGIINGPALMAAADCAMWLAIKARIGVEGRRAHLRAEHGVPRARQGRARVLHGAHPEAGPAPHLRRRRMPRQEGQPLQPPYRDLCPRRLTRSDRRCGATPPSSSRRTRRAGTGRKSSRAKRCAASPRWVCMAWPSRRNGAAPGMDYTALAVACEEICRWRLRHGHHRCGEQSGRRHPRPGMGTHAQKETVL